MASQTNSVRFDKLTEHNHTSWKFHLKAHLGAKDLDEFLTHTPVAGVVDPDILRRSKQALCELQMTVSNSMIHVIRDCLNAQAAYTAIQA